MFKAKKYLSMVLTISLLITLLGVFSVRADEISISNANLDSVNPTPRPMYWSVYTGGGTLLSDNTIKRGSEGYSVKFSNYTSTATFTGTVTGAEVGKMYTVSFFYYVEAAPESGTGTMQLYSNLSHAGGVPTNGPTTDTLTIDKSFVSDKWRLFKHTFVCDSIANSTVALFLSGNGFTVYVDDFSIKPENNILAFGGNFGQTKVTTDYSFELDSPKGPYGWNINSTSGSPNVAAVYDNSDPIEGNYSLKLTKLLEQNNGIHRLIPNGVLQTGVQYKLSYKIKALPVTSGDNSVTMAMRMIEGTSIWHSAVATLDWEQHEFYFKLTDSFNAADVSIPLYFNLHGTGSNAVVGDSVLVDDVNITKASNEFSIKNLKGFDITSAKPGETVKANLARVAGADNTDTVLHILGTYEKVDATGVEKLIKLDYFNNITSTGILANVTSTSLTMPALTEGKTYILKGFVWEGADTLKPYVDSITVVQSK